MPRDLAGKVALVTGVGRVGQVGHAVALAFGRAGSKLVIADVNARALADRAAELKGQGFDVRAAPADLATPEGARKAVATARDEQGGLDIVVNVAGGLVSYGPVSDLSAEQLERELTINLKTAFFVSQAAIPALVARGGGAIVNFSSIAVLKPQALMTAYTAAKAGVAGLTRALARELKDSGIRVNAVAPAALSTGDNIAQMKESGVRLVALDDVVRAVLYLASDDARGVSGEILPVTGGGDP